MLVDGLTVNNSETILPQEYTKPGSQDQKDKITDENKYHRRSDREVQTRLESYSKKGDIGKNRYLFRSSGHLFNKVSRKHVIFPKIARSNTNKRSILAKGRTRLKKVTSEEKSLTLPKIKRNRYILREESVEKKDTVTLPPIMSKRGELDMQMNRNDGESDSVNLQHMCTEDMLARDDRIHFKIDRELYSKMQPTWNSSNEKFFLSDDCCGPVHGGNERNMTPRSTASFQTVCSCVLDTFEQNHIESGTSDYLCTFELGNVQNRTSFDDNGSGTQPFSNNQLVNYNKTPLSPLYSRNIRNSLSNIGRNKHTTDPSGDGSFCQRDKESNDSLAQGQMLHCKSSSDEGQDRYTRSEIHMDEQTNNIPDTEGLPPKCLDQTGDSETDTANYLLSTDDSFKGSARSADGISNLSSANIHPIEDDAEAYEFQETSLNDPRTIRKKIMKTHVHAMASKDDNEENDNTVDSLFTLTTRVNSHHFNKDSQGHERTDGGDDNYYLQYQIFHSGGELWKESKICSKTLSDIPQEKLKSERQKNREYKESTKKKKNLNSDTYGSASMDIEESDEKKRHENKTNSDYKAETSFMSEMIHEYDKRQNKREKANDSKDNNITNSACSNTLDKGCGCKSYFLHQPGDDRSIKEYAEIVHDMQRINSKSKSKEKSFITNYEAGEISFGNTEHSSENDENDDMEILNFSHSSGWNSALNIIDDVTQREEDTRLHKKYGEFVDRNELCNKQFVRPKSWNVDTNRHNSDSDHSITQESSSISLAFEDHGHSSCATTTVTDRKFSSSSCNEHLDEKMHNCSNFNFPFYNPNMNDVSKPEIYLKTISGRKRSPYDNQCADRESRSTRTKNAGISQPYCYDSNDSKPGKCDDSFEDMYYGNKLNESRGFSEESPYNTKIVFEKHPSGYRQEKYSRRNFDGKSISYAKEVNSSGRTLDTRIIKRKKYIKHKESDTLHGQRNEDAGVRNSCSMPGTARFSDDMNYGNHYECNDMTEPSNGNHINMASDLELDYSGKLIDRDYNRVEFYQRLATRKGTLKQNKYQRTPDDVILDRDSRQHFAISESKRSDHHSRSETVLTYAKIKGSNRRVQKKVSNEEGNGSLHFYTQAEVSVKHLDRGSQNEYTMREKSVRNISVDMSTLSSNLHLDESDSDASSVDNDINNHVVIKNTKEDTSTAYAPPIDACTGSSLQSPSGLNVMRCKKGRSLKSVREDLSPPHIPIDIAFDKNSLTSAEPDLELEFDEVIDIGSLEICSEETKDLNKINRREDRRRRHKHRKKKRKRGHGDGELPVSKNKNDSEEKIKDVLQDSTDIEKFLGSSDHNISRDIEEIDDETFFKSIEMIDDETKRFLLPVSKLDSYDPYEQNVENKHLEPAPVDNYTYMADEEKYLDDTKEVTNEYGLHYIPKTDSRSPSSKNDAIYNENDNYSHFKRHSVNKHGRDTSRNSTKGGHHRKVAQMIEKNSQVHGAQKTYDETSNTDRRPSDACKATIPRHGERRHRRKKSVSSEVIEVDFSELPSIQTQIAKIMYNYDYDGQANTTRSSSRSSKQSYRRHSIATLTTDRRKMYRSKSSCNNTRRPSIKSASKQKRSRSLPHASDLKALQDRWGPENVENLLGPSNVPDYEDSFPLRITKKQFKTSKMLYI